MKKNDNLILVFVKNPELGKVKTRLAKTVGDENALTIYLNLLQITEKATEKIENADLHIFYSKQIELKFWKNSLKFIQKGTDLGEKMLDAFEQGFSLNYKKIIIIGSDLPEISPEIMQDALSHLDETDVVFGPAKDGGYYLLGMKTLYPCIFKNKSWSTSSLLYETKKELEEKNIQLQSLKMLNDIDTYEDLLEFEQLFNIL